MWICGTITELCWHNFEGLLQFLPCSLAGHQPPGPFIHTLPLQPRGKDLFPYKSPPVVSQSCGLQNIYRSHPRIILNQLLITLFLQHHIESYQFDALS